MKIKQFPVLFALLLFRVFPLPAQEQSLSWTMALVNSKGQSFSLAQPAAMQTQDIITLSVSAKAPAYVYIIVQDASRDVEVLHSGRARANEVLSMGPLRIIPPEGTETFYVVVSLTEQTELQEAVDAYNENRSSRNSRNLITAIMNIRRSVSRLKENPEKPVSMGGAFRGGETRGTEYSGLGTYVKTVIITH
jgi:hypothetical protein